MTGVLRLAPRFIVIGLAGGVLSGLLGVGGGIVMVPLLVLWASYGQRDAHAMSLGAIIPISLAGVITYG
ncbi:MAG: TSUP family transporter, partial [Gaiellaceae bacterium]